MRTLPNPYVLQVSSFRSLTSSPFWPTTFQWFYPVISHMHLSSSKTREGLYKSPVHLLSLPPSLCTFLLSSPHVGNSDRSSLFKLISICFIQQAPPGCCKFLSLNSNLETDTDKIIRHTSLFPFSQGFQPLTAYCPMSENPCLSFLFCFVFYIFL